MVTLETAQKTRVQTFLVFAVSAVFNALLIGVVLAVLEGGELRIVEGGVLANLSVILAMAALFSYIFLRNEMRKASFQTMMVEDDVITIKRMHTTERLERETMLFIHTDQHFYRVIRWHRISILTRREGKRRVHTLLVNREQKEKLIEALKASSYQPLLRLKKN